MADSEAPLVAKQHCGDEIGGVGRLFGDVLGGDGLFLIHRDRCCQMAKFDPFLSLDCARVEGVGRNRNKRLFLGCVTHH